MEKFGIVLCMIGLLGTLCSIGYAIFHFFGWIGAAIYTSVLCLIIGRSMITMD